jgi:hypothetical protein
VEGKPSNPLVFPRSVGDRVLIGLLGIASGLTAGVTGALLLPIRPEPWIERAGLALTVEALFTFALFSGLAVVWAIFMPQWLDRALAIAANKTLLAIGALALASLGIIGILLATSG